MMVITEGELRAIYGEIDAMREPGREPLTEEQIDAIRYARGGDSPVSWAKISAWFNKKYGKKINHSTLRDRYERVCGVRNGVF